MNNINPLIYNYNEIHKIFIGHIIFIYLFLFGSQNRSRTRKEYLGIHMRSNFYDILYMGTK